MSLTLNSNSFADRGLFNLKVTGTNGVWTTYTDFTVEITVNHCYYALMTPNTITPMTYEINQTAISQNFPDFGNNDTSCPITYTFMIGGTLYSGVTGAFTYSVDGSGVQTLTLHSTVVVDAGTFSCRLVGTNGIWTNYTDFTVDITVSPCYYAIITPYGILDTSY